MSSITEAATKLLDFNQPLDVNLLDTMIGCLYSGYGDQQRIAQETLTRLKEKPESYTKVSEMLENSSNPHTKYYALQILEQVIKTRWNILPRAQCEGIKKFIVGLIIKASSDPATMEKERTFLNKLNIILVQVLKREWPKNWKSFIPDIVGASKTNESICQNNMAIFKLLSEDVYDFSRGQMTQAKTKYMKDTMCSEFAQIFELCQLVLETSQNAPLVEATLETLLRFLNWIPLGYIFETSLITLLITKFLNVPMFRNVTLKCLTEIAGISHPDLKKNEVFVSLYTQTMAQLQVMIPLSTNIRDAYAAGADKEQNFIQNLALFLCTLLKEHATVIEQVDKNQFYTGLCYLVLISEVEEMEIFKICIEFWAVFCADLYQAEGKDNIFAITTYNPALERKLHYADILTKVRCIMISRMAKPEEVLVVENENGEVVREFMKDTDAISLYKNMRETLVYLTHLDYVDTEKVMTNRLERQVNGIDWSWKNINTLCWAVGSISGALEVEDEKKFLVIVIKDLLCLCEQKKGKDNKAIIASNIMYVVGQYPRFLRAHWKFLKTVVNKLFEFMHETHDGVQDMACDTFVKIALKCRRCLVLVQAGESRPFIDEILANAGTTISDLSPQQTHTFYEAVGYIVACQVDYPTQETLIKRYMALPNQTWDEVMESGSADVNVFKSQTTVSTLSNVIKTNLHACKALGHPYVLQMNHIYFDMLKVYKVMSENINVALSVHGEAVIRQPLIKGMRGIKKEILKLISTYVACSVDEKPVLDSILPPLYEAVLLDYQMAPVAVVREPEVLSTMAVIIRKLQDHVTSSVDRVFATVFECTLVMITNDLEVFPEHRLNFYVLLQAINDFCFPALLAIQAEQFKLVMDAIFWAFKHTMRNVAEVGLEILLQLMKNIEQSGDTAQSFYQRYLTEIVKHVLAVATDTSHTACLTNHAMVLAHVFSTVEQGGITVQLGPIPDNKLYIQEFVASLLQSEFSHLSASQIHITVKGLFDLNKDIPAFKAHLRDFLVQIREFFGADDVDLFLEEREAELRKAAEEKLSIQRAVPGILNPHEIVDEMQD